MYKSPFSRVVTALGNYAWFCFALFRYTNLYCSDEVDIVPIVIESLRVFAWAYCNFERYVV